MAGGTVGTVRARLRLPTVAECAELLAGGWSPLLGRLGVWADDEAVPGHGVRDAWGADRACGAVVTSEGSEGR